MPEWTSISEKTKKNGKKSLKEASKNGTHCNLPRHACVGDPRIGRIWKKKRKSMKAYKIR